MPEKRCCAVDWINQFEAIAGSHPAFAVFLAFIGGFLAGFTPCSYPMIPITVAFIGGKSKGSRFHGFMLSSVYVLGLALVYSGLGAFAALSGNLFGSLSNSPWVHFTVGNICLFFGLASMEVFPLSPPAILNRLRVKDIPGHDVITSLLLGGASALMVSSCPHSRCAADHRRRQARSFLGNEHAFRLCIRHGWFGHSGGHLYRPSCVASPFGSVDETGAEVLRVAHDSRG